MHTDLPRFSGAEEALLARIIAQPIAEIPELISDLENAKGHRRTRKGHPTGSVRTLIHRLRTKLEPHGIEIETQRGVGWYMTMRNKWKLKQLFTSPDAAPAPHR